MSKLQEIVEIKIIDGMVVINNKKYTPLQSMKLLGNIIFNVTKKQNIDRVINAGNINQYGIINNLRENSITIARDEKTVYIHNQQSITFTYKYKLLEIEYIEPKKTLYFNNNNNMSTLNNIINSM